MSNTNIPRLGDQVSENEVEITHIVKSAQGNILRHTAEAEFTSNLKLLTSGPNLGLDERQRNLKDTEEDSSQQNDLADDEEMSQAQIKSKGPTKGKPRPHPTDFKMNHWSCQVVEPVNRPATPELQFSKNFSERVDEVCSEALKEHPRKQSMVLRDLLFRALPISFEEARIGGREMGNIMIAWDMLNHQEYDKISPWFVRNDKAPFSHPPRGSPMEDYLLARGFYNIRQMRFQIFLAKKRYESIKGATKNAAGVWIMRADNAPRLNVDAATVSCFLFSFLGKKRK
jgi:hypothetical protein